MPHTVHRIPLAEIDPASFARDRTGLDPEPLDELRVSILRPRLTVRRERTAEGYVLRFSGVEATSTLLDDVLDEIERMYAPG